MRAEQLTDAVTFHGEGPVYCDRWPGLRWVDMIAGDVLELALDGTISRHHVGSVAAVIRPRRGGGHVIADERRIVVADTDELDAPTRALPELWTDTSVRMNEGGCDPAGAFYAGSVSYRHDPGAAKLFRLAPDWSIDVVLDSVGISNGLDWSPDDTTAYYVDTAVGRIDRFDWDEATGLRERRPFVRFEDSDGLPDGIAVDEEGGVWVAMFGTGAVRRYSADGALTEVIALPVRGPTAIAFSGPNRDQLVITTTRKSLDEPLEPASGALFTAWPQVRGLRVREFAG
ncbi:SMP-30/gluconolactonase/LRE family protein [Galbitalea sp. SE-J8]|uniref:SMP-30/gluconolactonase/LRE family protein n=1 Tax=Galbitalea sp. SE-J8 TaxID=3054952 RepID=UPI00259C9B0B|nr:SMP-30/gluconolactonase/LRE family protein [Galbitalea sp. SE-J8]MDM4763001.1 SMP-30/gluconolactonase/LRE family protein [Galbitalea sp. SE-J8]